MSEERVDMERNILVVTKGHPFEREPFFQLFDDMPAVNWTHVEQPAARALYTVEQGRSYDAYVAYDMPGIAFGPDGPDFEAPPESLRSDFKQLVAAGHGFVFLHHAIAGWPAWPEYGDLMGGRFLYVPGKVRGEDKLDSGYKHGVTHQVQVLTEHPVTAGIPPTFEITDELYLYEVFDKDVTPLLASNYAFTRDNFYSAAHVVQRGRMNDRSDWDHPPGSNLVGWTREVGKSRIVYLQCGDDPAAYGNEHFRRLISNAIDWVSDRGD
jgi:type 1 glutamine amidotransferase